MLKLLKSFNNALVAIMNWLMILMMSAMVVFIFMQVIYRYVLQHPLSWSEEVSRYLFSGITLFGAALLFRESKHINMALLTDKLKSQFARNVFSLACQIICIAFLVVVIWYGWPMAQMIIDFEVESPSMPWLRMGWVFMMLPIASLVSVSMLLEVVLNAIKTLKTEEAK